MLVVVNTFMTITSIADLWSLSTPPTRVAKLRSILNAKMRQGLTEEAAIEAFLTKDLPLYARPSQLPRLRERLGSLLHLEQHQKQS